MKVILISAACVIVLVIVALFFLSHNELDSYSEFDYMDHSSTGFSKIPLIIKDGFPYVAANIDSVLLTLMVDLGNFAAISIDDSIIAKTSVTYNKKDLSFVDAKSNKMTWKGITIPRIDFGSFSFLNIKGFEQKWPPGNEPPHCQGMVGINLLKKFIVVINYRQKKLTIAEPGKLPGSYDLTDWYSIKLQESSTGNYYVTALIENHACNLIWDTGFSQSRINIAFLKKHGLDSEVIQDFYTVDSMLIGKSYTMSNYKLHVQKDLPEDIVLGYDFFMNHVLRFHFMDNQLLIAGNGPETIR